MTTLPRVITDKIRHWILSAEIIHGLVSEPTSRIIVSPVRLAHNPRQPNTDHMAISDNFRSPKNPGIRYPWISLSEFCQIGPIKWIGFPYFQAGSVSLTLDIPSECCDS